MNPLYIVVGILVLFGGKLELPSLPGKKPPTKELAAAQDQLAAAQVAQAKAEAEQAKAEAALLAAETARQKKLAEQLDYTQQMVAGTDLALQKVPLEHRSPEVKLAAEFSGRAVAGFEAARGRLSTQQRAEIDQLFTNAIAAKNAEVETLKGELVKKDADLQAVTQEKKAIEKQIPVLQAEATTAKAETTSAKAETQAVAAKVETKTAEVANYADKMADEKAKNSSLDAWAGLLARIIIGLGILYALIHYVLPNLAQEFPAVGWLVKLNQTAKSIASSHL